MLIALAQFNPTVGDFEGNSARILDLANQAKRFGDLVPGKCHLHHAGERLNLSALIQYDHRLAARGLVGIRRGVDALGAKARRSQSQKRSQALGVAPESQG